MYERRIEARPFGSSFLRFGSGVIPDQTSKRTKVARVNGRRVIDVVWGDVATRSVAWNQVETEHDMAECINPEHLWSARGSEKTSNFFSKSSISSFRHAIQFRRVRRSQLMLDTLLEEIVLETTVDILSAVVTSQFLNAVLTGLLKESSKMGKRLKRLVFRFQWVHSRFFQEIIDECDPVLKTLTRPLLKPTHI